MSQSEKVAWIFKFPGQVYFSVFLCRLLEAESKALDVLLNYSLGGIHSHMSDGLVFLLLQISVHYIRHF